MMIKPQVWWQWWPIILHQTCLYSPYLLYIVQTLSKPKHSINELLAIADAEGLNVVRMFRLQRETWYLKAHANCPDVKCSLSLLLRVPFKLNLIIGFFDFDKHRRNLFQLYLVSLHLFLVFFFFVLFFCFCFQYFIIFFFCFFYCNGHCVGFISLAHLIYDQNQFNA